MNIRYEKLKISDEIKEKINLLTRTANIEVTYYNGYIIKFEKSKVESISPHKILLSNPLKNLLIMYYADYIENDDLYFIDGESVYVPALIFPPTSLSLIFAIITYLFFITPLS